MKSVPEFPIEVILKQEEQNNFAEAYLYFSDSVQMWVAYGPSAYTLRLMCKKFGCDCQRSFSLRTSMPCSILCDESVALLKSVGLAVEEKDATLHITFADTMDRNDYRRWVARLKEVAESDKVMHIETSVSKFVPKGEYIPDGMSIVAQYTKRASDFILSFIAIIVFSPLYLICYILVKRGDGGPAIYKQERIGRFGRPFYIYKFRTMRLDAEKMGPQLSHGGGDNDPRLTKIGKSLRAHHLDELPQLFNVFIGDMSFVGHRPERKFYIDQIMEYDKRYIYLYQIRPGVTSYATLHNGYTDTMEKMLQRLEYDLYYLRHRSAWFDFKILFQTFCRIVFGKIF